MEPCSEGPGHLQLYCTLTSLLLFGSFCVALGWGRFSPCCGWNVPLPGILQKWKGWQVFEIHLNAWFYIKEFSSDKLIMLLCFSARWLPTKCCYTVPKRPTWPWNEGHCCCWDWINVSWCLFCHVSLSRSPASPIPTGVGEHDAAPQGGCLGWTSLPCPAAPPAAPCEDRQGPAGGAEGLWLFSPVLSKGFRPFKSTGQWELLWQWWVQHRPSCAESRMSPSTSPLAPWVAEVMLGVTALCLHLPSKGGGPETLRTFKPVSSLSLVPLGNTDFSSQWFSPTGIGQLFTVRISHTAEPAISLSFGLGFFWFFLFSPSTSRSSAAHQETEHWVPETFRAGEEMHHSGCIIHLWGRARSSYQL